MPSKKNTKNKQSKTDDEVELTLLISRLTSNEEAVIVEALQLLQDHIEQLPDTILNNIADLLSAPSSSTSISEEAIYLISSISKERDDLRELLLSNVALFSLLFSYFDNSSVYVQIAIGNLLEDLSEESSFKSIIQNPELTDLISPIEVLIKKLTAGFEGTVISSIEIISKTLSNSDTNLKKLFIFYSAIDQLITLIKAEFSGSLRRSALELLIKFMNEDEEIINTVSDSLADFNMIFDDFEKGRMQKDDSFDVFLDFLSLIPTEKLDNKIFAEHLIRCMYLAEDKTRFKELIMKLDNKKNMITHLVFSAKTENNLQFQQDASIIADNSLILKLYESHFDLDLMIYLINNNFASTILLVSAREDLVKIRNSIINELNDNQLALFCVICSNINSFLDPLKNIYTQISENEVTENSLLALLFLSSVPGFPIELFSYPRDGLTGVNDAIYETVLVNLGMSNKSGAFKPVEDHLAKSAKSQIITEKVLSLKSSFKGGIVEPKTVEACQKCDAMTKKMKRIEKKAQKADELEKKLIASETYIRTLIELLEDNYIEYPEMDE